MGLSKVGGKGYDSSGDLFLAFSTGNSISTGLPIHSITHPVVESVQMARNDSIGIVCMM